jgi:hypothetical protein
MKENAMKRTLLALSTLVMLAVAATQVFGRDTEIRYASRHGREEVRVQEVRHPHHGYRGYYGGAVIVQPPVYAYPAPPVYYAPAPTVVYPPAPAMVYPPAPQYYYPQPRGYLELRSRGMSFGIGL